ncbi:uncharacterized protein PWA37_001607 [Arxiozyma heterogenica]|uniref:Uncharacterized protein n=1 Tax=Arxiozyma heterogenica TaxID=278026 RepID=A0AAN7WMV8_9SACH|nr:hypothetical protein RI543_002558 [Kazachstania heterogenica]
MTQHKRKSIALWRRSTPSLYHHLSSFKPSFISSVDNMRKLHKTIIFRSEVIPDKERGFLSTSLLYSQGSDIYEIDCNLPLGSFYKESESLLSGGFENKETSDSIHKDNKDINAFEDASTKKLNSKWIYSGETIAKMAYLDDSEDSTVIVMSKNGSLAWFRDGIKVPIHIVQEMMGPSTSFSAIHSHKRPNDLAVSDFGLSESLETLVKSQANGTEENSILKIVDNSGKPGEILRVIHVPGTTVTHTVRFFDNNIFGLCSDDNTVRFWDVRTANEPIFSLSEPKNGKLTAFDASQVTNELFITGTSTGVIKLWDIRAVEFASKDLSYRQNGEDPIQNELVSLCHSGGDSVIDVQFSKISSAEFLTVGNTGNVYHWDMEYFFSRNDDDNEQQYSTSKRVRRTTTNSIPALEELQGQCLKFFHSGVSNNNGSSSSKFGRKNTVAWHPIIDDLVCTVNDSSLVSVYKPFTLKSSNPHD